MRHGIGLLPIRGDLDAFARRARTGSPWKTERNAPSYTSVMLRVQLLYVGEGFFTVSGPPLRGEPSALFVERALDLIGGSCAPARPFRTLAVDRILWNATAQEGRARTLVLCGAPNPPPAGGATNTCCKPQNYPYNTNSSRTGVYRELSRFGLCEMLFDRDLDLEIHKLKMGDHVHGTDG